MARWSSPATAFVRAMHIHPCLPRLQAVPIVQRRPRSSLVFGAYSVSRCCLRTANGVNEAIGNASAQSPEVNTRRVCRVADVRGGSVSYGAAWHWQRALAEQLRADPGASDALLVLEHAPVYTLGTASVTKNVRFRASELRAEDLSVPFGNCMWHNNALRDGARGAEFSTIAPALIRTERGGEVTYHGPGQLVAYPILNLKRHRQDLHWYLRSLEEVVIVMLRRHYGVEAGRKSGMAGVWVEDSKVCAMGLKVSKWVTMHGLALNVTTDLSAFDRIVPCGISEFGVTSLEHLAHGSVSVTMDEARSHFIEAFNDVIGPYDSLDSFGDDTVAELQAIAKAGVL